MTLAAHLNTLESTGLVHLAQTLPELEYLFRHALIQDAAYRSLVKADRRALHRAVGEMLERAYPDRIDELAPLLARHFDEAGDDHRALKYFTQAGDVAARTYANAEAAQHYARALDLARQVPDAAHLQLVHLCVSYGSVLRLNGRFDLALAHYVESERLAQSRGDRALELAVLMERATIHSTPTPVQNRALGQQLLERALSLARELSDPTAEARIYWNLMLGELFGGSTHEAVGYGEQSLALAREHDLREQLAFTLSDLSFAYVFVGEIQRGRAALSEVRAVWQSLGNLPMLADNLSNSALTSFYVGEHGEALRFGEEALRLSRSIGNKWGQSHALGMMGYALQETGQMGEALAAWESSVELGAQAGLVATQIGIRADLAWLYGSLGVLERALELARLALATSEKILPIWSPWASAVQARLLLLAGHLDEAEQVAQSGCPGRIQDYFTRLLMTGAVAVTLVRGELALARRRPEPAVTLANDLAEHLQSIGARTFVSDALHLKARALQVMGQVDAAAAVLAEARAYAEAIGSRRSVWPILSALSEIASQRGRPAEADELRGQARVVVNFIADHLTAAEIRTSFLNLPDVRRVAF